MTFRLWRCLLLLNWTILRWKISLLYHHQNSPPPPPIFSLNTTILSERRKKLATFCAQFMVMIKNYDDNHHGQSVGFHLQSGVRSFLSMIDQPYHHQSYHALYCILFLRYISNSATVQQHFIKLANISQCKYKLSNYSSISADQWCTIGKDETVDDKEERGFH